MTPNDATSSRQPPSSNTIQSADASEAGRITCYSYACQTPSWMIRLSSRPSWGPFCAGQAKSHACPLRSGLLNNGTCTKMEPEAADAGSTAVIMGAAGHAKCEIRPLPCRFDSAARLSRQPASQPALFLVSIPASHIRMYVFPKARQGKARQGKVKSLRLSGTTGGSRINRSPGMIWDWTACLVSGSQRFMPSFLMLGRGLAGIVPHHHLQGIIKGA